MDRFSFELCIVKSNPSHSDEPRVYIVKKNQKEKIIWAFEIDEFHETFLNTEFNYEEAEVWLSHLSIEDGIIIGNKSKKKKEKASFCESIRRGIEILLSPNCQIFYGEDSKVYPAKKVDRKNRKERKLVDEIEDAHIKNLSEQAIEKNKSKRHNTYIPMDFDDYEESSNRKRR
jgi:predicted mannosyl-3-phosphoglycerate phosphatase (HAD superfamily)